MDSKKLHGRYICLIFGAFIILMLLDKDSRNLDVCKLSEMTFYEDLTWARDCSELCKDHFWEIEVPTASVKEQKYGANKENFIVLSAIEQRKAIWILRNYFRNDREFSKSKTHFPLSYYFRQYVGYKSKNDVMVHVNLYSYRYTLYAYDCLCAIVQEDPHRLLYHKNGGKNYGTIIINLSKQRVVYSYFEPSTEIINRMENLREKYRLFYKHTALKTS